MTHLKEDHSGTVRELRPTTREKSQPTELSDLVSSATVSSKSMKLISWPEIWASLGVAKMRDNREMIKLFYDALFKDAAFDDSGAWFMDRRKRN